MAKIVLTIIYEVKLITNCLATIDNYYMQIQVITHYNHITISLEGTKVTYSV